MRKVAFLLTKNHGVVCRISKSGELAQFGCIKTLSLNDLRIRSTSCVIIITLISVGNKMPS